MSWRENCHPSPGPLSLGTKWSARWKPWEPAFAMSKKATVSASHGSRPPAEPASFAEPAGRICVRKRGSPAIMCMAAMRNMRWSPNNLPIPSPRSFRMKRRLRYCARASLDIAPCAAAIFNRANGWDFTDLGPPRILPFKLPDIGGVPSMSARFEKNTEPWPGNWEPCGWGKRQICRRTCCTRPFCLLQRGNWCHRHCRPLKKGAPSPWQAFI